MQWPWRGREFRKRIADVIVEGWRADDLARSELADLLERCRGRPWITGRTWTAHEDVVLRLTRDDVDLLIKELRR